MLNNMRIGTRLLWQAVGMAIWFVILVATALHFMKDINQDTRAIFEEKMAPAVLIMQIQTLMAENSLQIASGLLHDPRGPQAEFHDHPVTRHLDQVVANRDAINDLWKRYKARKLTEEENNLADTYERARMVYVKEGLLPAREALLAGDFQKALEIDAKVLRPAYVNAKAAADKMREFYVDTGKSLYQSALNTYDQSMRLMVGGALLVSMLIAVFAYLFARSITRPVASAVALAESVANGQLDHQIEISGKDEVSELLRALEKMQFELKQNIDAERLAANETLRIKTALDVSSNSVMVADTDGKIIYCNESVLQMMRIAEADIRKQLPNFNADAILGSNFDIYHKQPSHQRNMLAMLKGTHRTEMTIGGRYFTLVAVAIVNDIGERLGTVVEWRDRTAEVLIENEVASIINAAVDGDFSKRIDSAQMSGFFKQISDGINNLLEANTKALAEVGAMLTRMSQGDLTQKIDTHYEGMLGQLKNDANATIDNLTQIIQAIKEATDAINTAANEIAAGNQDLSSRTEEQASSLEETASSMEELTSTVKQNANNATQANELANNAQSVAVMGGEVVGQVVDTMSAIHLSSSKIADIIGVIDGIAFQTNILALNAAVEAARAGEQGRGFAVVATEVRNLAQRSAAAAKEIKGLISDSVNKVEAGNQLVHQAGRTMAEVVSSIKQVAKIMSDISDASREQSSGIEQVSLALSQMDEVTQQNAALVEEAAAAAESLEEQAGNLARAVSVFVVDASTGCGKGDAPGRASQSLEERRKLGLKSAAIPVANSLDDEWEEF